MTTQERFSGRIERQNVPLVIPQENTLDIDYSQRLSINVLHDESHPDGLCLENFLAMCCSTNASNQMDIYERVKISYGNPSHVTHSRLPSDQVGVSSTGRTNASSILTSSIQSTAATCLNTES